MPIFLVKNKRIGKRVIVRPFFLFSDYFKKSLGLKWIINASSRKAGSFHSNLTEEIFNAFYNKGNVKKKQIELNTVVLNNKSNLKYRW